jgi:PAS domain S-box-containing protein
VDRNLRIVRINEAMAAINGLSVAQTLGRRVDEILPDLVARLRPILCRVLETGEAVVNLEVKGNTPLAPGVERAWLASYYPVRVGRGPVVGVGTIVTEITERNRAQAEAERLLRQEREARARAESLAAERAAILSHLADGVMIVDADRRITYLNDAARRLLGDGRLDRYVGDYDDQFRLTGPNGEALARDDMPLAKAVDRGETTIRENLRIERPGLPPVLIELSAAPIVGDRGSRHGAVATFHDVTGQRELDRQRDVFLSSASHDLKTPLTVIQASAELLERRVMKIASPDVRELVPKLQRIRTSSKKMVALLDELLDVSRMRLGRPVDLDRRRTNLKAVLHQVASEYQAATDHHTISVEAPLSEVVGCWDAARLERIFGNLLSNAVKYSPDGGPIRVSVRPSKDTLGYWAVVDVEDHGMGIPADDLPHIFERWQRAGNVPGHIRGTGIGLAIVRFLVTQHGGTVWATSQEGMGSTFTVKLPLQEECGHES